MRAHRHLPTVPDDEFGGPEPDNAHLTGVILRLNDDRTTSVDNPFLRPGRVSAARSCAATASGVSSPVICSSGRPPRCWKAATCSTSTWLAGAPGSASTIRGSPIVSPTISPSTRSPRANPAHRSRLRRRHRHAHRTRRQPLRRLAHAGSHLQDLAQVIHSAGPSVRQWPTIRGPPPHSPARRIRLSAALDRGEVHGTILTRMDSS